MEYKLQLIFSSLQIIRKNCPPGVTSTGNVRRIAILPLRRATIEWFSHGVEWHLYVPRSSETRLNTFRFPQFTPSSTHRVTMPLSYAVRRVERTGNWNNHYHQPSLVARQLAHWHCWGCLGETAELISYRSIQQKRRRRSRNDWYRQSKPSDELFPRIYIGCRIPLLPQLWWTLIRNLLSRHKDSLKCTNRYARHKSNATQFWHGECFYRRLCHDAATDDYAAAAPGSDDDDDDNSTLFYLGAPAEQFRTDLTYKGSIQCNLHTDDVALHASRCIRKLSLQPPTTAHRTGWEKLSTRW